MCCGAVGKSLVGDQPNFSRATGTHLLVRCDRHPPKEAAYIHKINPFGYPNAPAMSGERADPVGGATWYHRQIWRCQQPRQKWRCWSACIARPGDTVSEVCSIAEFGEGASWRRQARRGQIRRSLNKLQRRAAFPRRPPDRSKGVPFDPPFQRPETSLFSTVAGGNQFEPF